MNSYFDKNGVLTIYPKTSSERFIWENHFGIGKEDFRSLNLKLEFVRSVDGSMTYMEIKKEKLDSINKGEIK